MPPNSLQQAGANALLKYVLRADRYHVRTLRCRRCSHVFLSPTFTAEEIDRFCSDDMGVATKLEYRAWEAHTGESWAGVHQVPKHGQKLLLDKADRLRAQALHDFVRPTPEAGSPSIGSILDVGGMSGTLTRLFTDARRHVYDKSLSCAEGSVIGLHDEREVAEAGPYDLLVFSHVLEHVPLPTDFVASFRECADENARIYVEVPLEYCGAIVKRKGAPLGGHINYFTPHSLRSLLVHAGFGRVLRLTQTAASYGEQRMVVIKALAAIGEATPPRSRSLRFSTQLLRDCALIWQTRRRASQEIGRVIAEARSEAGSSWSTEGS